MTLFFERVLIGCAVAILIAGCVTRREFKPDRPLSETRLFVTRADTSVTLSWESRAGVYYAVMFNSTRSATSPWRVLPGFERIAGTGQTLTFTDEVPLDQTRYYRLSVLQPAIIP